MLIKIVKVAQSSPFPVGKFYRRPQLIRCNLYFKFLFQTRLKFLHFLKPKFPGLRRSLFLRQLQQMNGLILSQQFIHFLFTITGGLRYQQIRKIKKWTGISRGKTIARLNERAHIVRQYLFCCCNGFLFGAA